MAIWRRCTGPRMPMHGRVVLPQVGQRLALVGPGGSGTALGWIRRPLCAVAHGSRNVSDDRGYFLRERTGASRSRSMAPSRRTRQKARLCQRVPLPLAVLAVMLAMAPGGRPDALIRRATSTMASVGSMSSSMDAVQSRAPGRRRFSMIRCRRRGTGSAYPLPATCGCG